METAAVSDKALFPQKDVDDVTTPEHRAIETMMTVLGNPFKNDYLDLSGYDAFLGIQLALMESPAFRRYKEMHDVDEEVAAELLVAGLVYAQLGGPNGRR